MHSRFLACCLAWGAGWLPLAAQDIRIKENITAATEYIEDPGGMLTFENISRPGETRWRKIGENATRFSFSRSVFWLRFDLKAFPHFTQMQNLYMVFEWKALDSLELFGGGGRMVSGDAFPKSQWSLPEAHFPAFRLEPARNPGGVYYVRLDSTSIKNFPIFLKSENAYLRELKQEITISFVYTTIVLVLVLFALFMYAMSRDLNFIVYIGYLLSIALAFDTTFGNAFDLFWPNATWWQNRAGFTLVGAQIVFSLLFVSRLLDFPRHLPKAELFCKILAIITAASLPLSLTELPVVWFSMFYSAIYLLSIPAFMGIGIYLLPRSGTHVRFFIAGWGIFFVFAYIHILYLRNILPFSNFYVYAPIFLMPVDILFFFISVWEKQRSVDRERLRLLDQKISILTARSKYQKSSLTEIDTAQILKKLEFLIDEEKIYLIENLRLPDLAKALGLNRTQLSELLNSHFQKNFANFINEYRVKEAQKRLIENPTENVLDIAFATGFGSKAAFSSEFKRVTGMTAKEFREQKTQKSA